jgi:hypothetical protein
MELQGVLLLVVGLALILMGLQVFLDKDKRKVSSEVIGAAFMMVTGLYMSYLYYQLARVGTSAPTTNSMAAYGP